MKREDLHQICTVLNSAAGTPPTLYAYPDDKPGTITTRPGHYHLAIMRLGTYELHQCINETGAVRVVRHELATRAMYDYLCAFIDGVTDARHRLDHAPARVQATPAHIDDDLHEYGPMG